MKAFFSRWAAGTILGVAFLISGSTGLALPMDSTPYPALRSGMRYYDVLKQWGPPSGKKVKETSRQEVWYYDGAEVLYLEGKVVAWSQAGNKEPKPAEPFNAQLVKNTGGAYPVQPADRTKLDELLGEIMQELPEE